ncbi:MAG: hypothetical protein IRZ33_03285 [Alicyclobacillaceae bacterium]|nr:hypothetical protein [Alicyclobacillaceae bacterium]
MQNRNVFSITVALLGALKLILQAFGYNLMTDQEVNDIANGVAAVVTVIGVVMTHLKKPDAGSSAPLRRGGGSAAAPASTPPAKPASPDTPPPPDGAQPPPVRAATGSADEQGTGRALQPDATVQLDNAAQQD